MITITKINIKVQISLFKPDLASNLSKDQMAKKFRLEAKN